MKNKSGLSSRDLSRKVIEELGRLNAALEWRLAGCAADLEKTKKNLSELSFALSHELRAPLRAMQGFSQILRQDHGSTLPPSIVQYLRTIEEEARRTAALIDKLLETSERFVSPRGSSFTVHFPSDGARSDGGKN